MWKFLKIVKNNNILRQFLQWFVPLPSILWSSPQLWGCLVRCAQLIFKFQLHYTLIWTNFELSFCCETNVWPIGVHITLTKDTQTCYEQNPPISLCTTYLMLLNFLAFMSCCLKHPTVPTRTKTFSAMQRYNVSANGWEMDNNGYACYFNLISFFAYLVVPPSAHNGIPIEKYTQVKL